MYSREAADPTLQKGLIGPQVFGSPCVARREIQKRAGDTYSYLSVPNENHFYG